VKWIVGILLLLNIGIYMWGSWYKPVTARIPADMRAPINASKMRPLQPAPPIAKNARQTEPLCVSIGPFNTAARAARAGAILRQLGIARLRQELLGSTVTSYRVYLPSLPSHAAAERQRAELTRLGIKDHYILEEPGKENAISLGLFNIEENAAALLGRLEEKGVKARQETLYSTRDTFWVVAELGAPQWQRLQQQKWPGRGARVLSRACPEGPAKAAEPTSVPERPGRS
jgi:cell division protein FtsN